MLYLFDANVLITASNTYYPIDQIPEFWEWLQFQGQAGKIKLPVEIMEEILAGKKDDDPLLAWMKGGPKPPSGRGVTINEERPARAVPAAAGGGE